ncbi:hypothetical protein SAMN03159423_4920 [Bradyrhizobium sp. NFR13]|uniref:hypothetical protein n=1 Tax=Bradyrhizobium sp. NFR13 TaxID=1566285 RepID=UPI0008E5E335|nr:hypothetical protein [Bradyrhizobium sp. NFR13]SFM02957.1 hypothetical protein SAMN03159423_4920 [Bradyrhizobium sp. NFR13]
MSWSARFPEPIALPDGGKLVTLKDAGAYITKLPKKTEATTAWQAAAHVLIQAADHGGPIEFARLGMSRALFPKDETIYRSVKKDAVWRNRHKPVRDR